ncbi:MAG: alpha/beta hydrolase [Lachnospiraceae bacterium]|nr:alpha/beta hydrolase [Lachnospiraceae bacterium]
MEITVDGLKINYEFRGEGEETVVILEGWGTSIPVYDSIAKVLAAKYRVLLFDLPGFGESDEPKSAWSVDDYVDFLLHFLKELGVHKVILLGHSYGGRMIIKLAARGQEEVEISRIVLVDSAGVMPKKTLWKRIKQARYKFYKKLAGTRIAQKICPELIADWKSRQGSADYRNASPIMKGCLVKAVNEDLTALFPKVTKDVLLIWGDKDTATPLSDAQLMESKMPSAGLAVVEGTGHYCFLEKPQIFQNILRAYFEI